MRGKNPIRPPEKGSGQTLYVQSIFPTLQGEGPNAGTPAVFVRLGGCNLACDFCDTEFESFNEMQLEAMLAEIDSHQIPFVVMTGGEPMRQNITPLCEALIRRNYKVQIETNGLLYLELPQQVEIICSPKNPGSGYYKIRKDLMARINAYKFIVSATHPLYKHIPEIKDNVPVYIQPMDEYDAIKNKQNRELAEKLVMEKNYLLSLQLHKILQLP